ncbi:MAG: DNA adenine methylase [Clostridia bacterium]|nr:DNA adenine methylase [Clostridia bacterium]
MSFLDPPYYGTEKYYQALFTKNDHINLRNVLGRISGKFILTYNDCEYIRELYWNFKTEEIQRNHNLVNRHEYKRKI